MPPATVSPLIFRDCDIRGQVGSEIQPDVAYLLGRAIGSMAHDGQALIGGDFRQSTPDLLDALQRGLLDSGVHVYNLGQLTTPAYYFARRKLGLKTGVMVTASHNPPSWNGFKPILGDFPMRPDEVAHLRTMIANQDFKSGSGHTETVDIKPDYVAFLRARFAPFAARFPYAVFDCGSGATGWVIREVIAALDLRASLMFETPDGTFPNRPPDISNPGDLTQLQHEVRRLGAGAGFGFDGDGDRVGAVDERGERVSPDRLIAWLAEELLRRNRGGTVIYDVKLSRLVPQTVERAGGQALTQKSGHTFIKAAVLRENAVMGGEYSGHIFYRELDGGDDGLFSALLVGAFLAEKGVSLSQALAHLPDYASTPDLRVKFTGIPATVFAAAAAASEAQGARLTLIDGVKAEFEDGWALVRASVTEPALTFRFEGPTKADLLAVARRFTASLGDIGPQIWWQVEQHANTMR